MKARVDSTELVMQELIRRLFEEKNLLKEQNRILMENVRDLKERNRKFQESHSTGAVSDKRKLSANYLKTSYAEMCRSAFAVPEVPSSWRRSNVDRKPRSGEDNLIEHNLGKFGDKLRESSINCRFCGDDHVWGKDKCPAFNTRCSNCFKMNHTAAVCFLKVEKLEHSKSASCIKNNHSEKEKSDNVKASVVKKKCKFCNMKHLWGSERCPAFGKTCAKCNMKKKVLYPAL